MAMAGEPDQRLVLDACDYLAKVAAGADRGGAVPLAFPVIESYPRAVHWTDWTYEPGLNPTAGLAGLLYQLRIDHPWVTQAASWCWDQLSGSELPADAHALSEVLVFLEHAPERDRAGKAGAEPAAARVVEHLSRASYFRADPDDPGYGLSPLQIAPRAGSRWRKLFPEELIQAHLDRLERDQQADGGWPITWEPPSEAALLEWRGSVTLDALLTLVSYGRVRPPAEPDLA